MRNRAAAIAAAIPAALITSISSADFTAAHYYDEASFFLLIQDMPDFDQVRVGDLPNNGHCFCGPTAISNLLAYVSSHGFPEYEPGHPFPGNWDSALHYPRISNLLADIGNNVGVSPGGGSGGCGVGPQPLYQELVDRIGGRFTVSLDRIDLAEGVTPTLASIARKSALNAAIGVMHYGRYNGAFNNGVFESTDRPNGHYETVIRAISFGEVRRVATHNPSDGQHDAVQSPFTAKWWDMKKQPFKSSNGDEMTVEMIGDAINSGSRIRVLNSHLSVAPKACLSWSDDGSEEVVRITPDLPIWAPNFSPSNAFSLPFTPKMIRPTPDDLATVSLVDNSLKMIDRASGEAMPLPALPSGEIRAFDIDRLGHIMVAIEKNLCIINPRTQELTVLELPGLISSVAAAVQDQESNASFLPHFKTYGSYVLMPGLNQVGVVMQNNTTGEFQVDIQPIDPGPKMTMADDTRLFVTERRGFALSDGQLCVFSLGSQFQRMNISTPATAAIRDLAVDDNDIVLISMGDDPAYSAWQVGEEFKPADWHPMHQVATRGRLVMVRSQSNHRRSEDVEHNELVEDWSDREDVVVCRADLNADGRVDSADIGLLLSEWGQHRSVADINRDLLVDSADLGLLLGEFGDCP